MQQTDQSLYQFYAMRLFDISVESKAFEVRKKTSAAVSLALDVAACESQKRLWIRLVVSQTFVSDKHVNLRSDYGSDWLRLSSRCDQPVNVRKDYQSD